MRTIKFRAWDKEEKVMIYDTDTVLIMLDGKILIGDDYCGCCDQYKYSTEEKSTVEILQYTGLKDKNGVEIYEGDITHHKWDSGATMKETISEVKFSNGAFVCDDKKRADFNVSIHALSGWAEIEVIGNIYENPELLEGGVSNE